MKPRLLKSYSYLQDINSSIFGNNLRGLRFIASVLLQLLLLIHNLYKLGIDVSGINSQDSLKSIFRTLTNKKDTKTTEILYKQFTFASFESKQQVGYENYSLKGRRLL